MEHDFTEQPLIAKTIKIYFKILDFFDHSCQPLLMFFLRFWMARIFWYSGLTKISSWQSTIYLFKDEYKVPVISPELAAYFSTTFELACPVLLVLGLATRLATLPMLAMTAVIQFTYLDLIDHRYWAMILCTILIIGPSSISVDAYLKRKLFGIF